MLANVQIRERQWPIQWAAFDSIKSRGFRIFPIRNLKIGRDLWPKMKSLTKIEWKKYDGVQVHGALMDLW